MRKNTQLALDAFLNKRKCKVCSSVWTDGHVIYSYDLPIACYTADGEILVTDIKSSKTTNMHINAIRGLSKTRIITHREL